MKRWLILLFIFFEIFLAKSQSYISIDSVTYENRMSWWKEAKFGMFIHWGLYSFIGYNEWAIENFNIPFKEYELFQKKFKPVNYKPGEWVQLAKDAGMKYVVITTKHHDGFCLFNSAYTDWDIMGTPYKRDVIGMLAKACRKKGLQFGAYYSVLDWHHPDYSPRRLYWDSTKYLSKPDSAKYLTYFKNQVFEIQQKYNPALFWFDWQKDMKDKNAMVQFWHEMLKNNPQLIINNRLYSNGQLGDYLTPENWVPSAGYKDKNGNPYNFEVCYSIDRTSWGYNPYSNSFLSTREIIRLLCDVAHKGGNLLLNVGPTPDGRIQEEFEIRLRETGMWMKKYGDAIYGTTASVFSTLPYFGRCTVKGNRLFLLVFSMPLDNIVRFPLVQNKIRKVSLMGNEKVLLSYKINEPFVEIKMPLQDYDVNCFVVEIVLDSEPVVQNIIPLYNSNQVISLPVFMGTVKPEARNFVQSYKIINLPFESNHDTLTYLFETRTTAKYNLRFNYALSKPGIPLNILINHNGSDSKITLPGIVNKKEYRYSENQEFILEKGVHCIKIYLPEENNGIIFRLKQLDFLPQ